MSNHLSLLSVFVHVWYVYADVTVVDTGVGQIAGEIQNVTLPGGSVSTLTAFRGIPYAEAPLGDLRFAKPQPKANFTERFDAFTFGPSCPQASSNRVVSSEECLYLNVFVPTTVQLPVSNNTAERLPVLVWIHGGAFVSGGGNRQVGTLVVYGNIILVTINYRLGALGFLSTGDQQALGNFGLWDQRLAMQWVKANIAAFGGEPDQITIGGGSAGSICVTHHATYPANQGLFKRFIAASGTILSVVGSRTNVGIYAKLLADRLGCNTSNTSEIVSCLRTKNATDIVNAPVPGQSPFDLPWAPTVDGDIVKQWPSDQVKWPPTQSDLTPFRSLDAMFGTTSAEGSISFQIWVRTMAQQLNQSVTEGVSDQLFDTVIRQLLQSQKMTTDRPLVDAITYEYRDWQNPSSLPTLGQSTVDLLTDRQWFIPNVVFSRNHAVNNTRTNTYLLQYDRPNFTGIYGLSWMRGAGHIVYESLAFGNFQPETPLNLSVQEHRVLWNTSKGIMAYWSNFVKTGNTSVPMSVTEEWLTFDLTDEHYLYLADDVISTRTRCKGKRTRFWLDYLPKVEATLTAPTTESPNGNKDCNASSGDRLTAHAVTMLAVTFMVWTG